MLFTYSHNNNANIAKSTPSTAPSPLHSAIVRPVFDGIRDLKQLLRSSRSPCSSCGHGH